VHVVRGQIKVNGQPLQTGDAIKLAQESALSLSDARDAEVLFFDLAADLAN
jgi:redox-sensitive bicupin YhaK (pirin superfamily)